MNERYQEDLDYFLNFAESERGKELDKKEYLFHKEKYHYSNEIDKIVLHEFERVKNLMKKRAFPFDNKKMFEYINVYYQIKKEQDLILYCLRKPR